MPKYPETGASIVIDNAKYNRDIQDVIDKAGKADTALNDIGGTVDVKVNVNDSEVVTAVRNVGDLDTTADVKVNADDSELDAVEDKLNTLITLSVIDLAINVTGSALGLVETLVNLPGVGGVIQIDNALAMIEGRTGRMIPQAEQLISDLYTNGWGESREQIGGVIAAAAQLGITNENLEEATFAAFNVAAVTGGEATEVLRTMDTMVKNNLAPDFQTAADIIVTGMQTGADRGEDLLDTFNEYGSTFGNLRISGEGALALINSGLAAGIDNSDRIADSVRELGIRLGEVGTTPAITEAFDKLDAFSDLDLAANLDAFNAGEMSGDEFFNGFYSALAELVAADPVEGGLVAAALVGTISEDFGPESVAQLTTVWDEDVMGAMEGRATEAGAAISSTLGSSITTFIRDVEQMAVDFLSADAIDLDGKIDAIKAGIASALGVLAEGGSVGEAIEIGLNIPGFADSVTRFEAGVGNFLISILELIAGIQDFTGHGDAAEATRDEIARLGAQQLTFDLQAMNADELTGAIQDAVARGVDPKQIGDLAGTAINELLASGDIAGAQAVIDGLGEVAAQLPVIADGLGGLEISLANAALLEFQGTGDRSRIDEQIAAGNLIAVEVDTETLQASVDEAANLITTQLNEALAAGDIDAALILAEQLGDQAAIDQINAIAAEYKTQFQAAMEGGDTGSAALFASWLPENDPDVAAFAAENAAALKTAFDTAIADQDFETAGAIADVLNDEELAQKAADIEANIDVLKVGVEAARDRVGQAADEMAASVEDADTRITAATTENTITTSFGAVKLSADENFPIVIQWIDDTAASIENLDDSAAILLNVVGYLASLSSAVDSFPLDQLNAINAAANGFAGAQAAAGAAGGNTYNTTVNNNNTNNAQAAAGTYDINRSLP